MGEKLFPVWKTTARSRKWPPDGLVQGVDRCMDRLWRDSARYCGLKMEAGREVKQAAR